MSGPFLTHIANEMLFGVSAPSHPPGWDFDYSVLEARPFPSPGEMEEVYGPIFEKNSSLFAQRRGPAPDPPPCFFCGPDPCIHHEEKSDPPPRVTGSLVFDSTSLGGGKFAIDLETLPPDVKAKLTAGNSLSVSLAFKADPGAVEHLK